MPFNTASSGAGGLMVQQYTGQLLLAALRESTIALDDRVTTTLVTPNLQVHLPLLTGDATGSWVAEGAEIPESLPVMAELVITPRKVASIAVITSEAATDSSPAAAEVIGQSLAQGLGHTLDVALFAASTTNGPSGLGGLSGVNAISAGSAWSTLDPFADAMANAESKGTSVTAFVGSYADVAALSKLKSATGSQVPLLGQDATVAGGRTVFGVPVVANSHVPSGSVYAMVRDRVVTVIRDDIVVEQSTDARFTSDQVVLRARGRFGFGFLQPAALSKISLNTS